MGEKCKRFIQFVKHLELPSTKREREFQRLKEQEEKKRNCAELSKHAEFLVKMHSGEALADYLNYLGKQGQLRLSPADLEQIRKNVTDLLPTYLDGVESGQAIATKVAVALGNREFIEKTFSSTRAAKKLADAAEVCVCGSPLFQLSASELKAFVKELVESEFLDSALYLLDSVSKPINDPDFEKEIKDGYKRILHHCTVKGKLDELWELVFKINVLLGNTDAAASILGAHNVNINRFTACIIRNDCVGAEQEFMKLWLPLVALYDLIFVIYNNGNIVTKHSADIVMNVALGMECSNLHSTIELMSLGLKLHKKYPNGNPAIEGFDTKESIDLLLLRLVAISFRNNYLDDAFAYLGELESRHPEIFGKG